jgi:hypothetical protein
LLSWQQTTGGVVVVQLGSLPKRLYKCLHQPVVATTLLITAAAPQRGVQPQQPSASYTFILGAVVRLMQVCVCCCAPVVAPVRPFTPEEAALWEESAQYAYRSFRDKAAASRNMPIDDMQVSAGRLWGLLPGVRIHT